VLAAWGGLGYYSRARNLHRAAKQVVELGAFPNDYDSIRQLAGVGEYTAAAIASIAFELPHAVVDGNVRRVLSRLACENEGIDLAAARLLDRKHPALYNQALMELGALVCLPRTPRCEVCPVAELCEAKRQARQMEFPAKPGRKAPVRVARTLLLAEKGGAVLLQKRDFWELPEAGQIPDAVIGDNVTQFRHSITNHNYVLTVVSARVPRAPLGFRWIPRRELIGLPLSTITRKALS
jgi:A/G-specific adenine glycosylase